MFEQGFIWVNIATSLTPQLVFVQTLQNEGSGRFQAQLSVNSMAEQWPSRLVHQRSFGQDGGGARAHCPQQNLSSPYILLLSYRKQKISCLYEDPAPVHTVFFAYELILEPSFAFGAHPLSPPSLEYRKHWLQLFWVVVATWPPFCPELYLFQC